MYRNPKRLRNYLKILFLPVALMILATAILVFQLTSHLQTVHREISGIRISTGLLQAMTILQEIGHLTMIKPVVDNQVDPASRISSLEADLNEKFNRILSDPAARVFGLKIPLRKLQEDLGLQPAEDMAPSDNIDKLYILIRQSADQSGLSLDPALESSYLISLIINHIPSQIQGLGRLIHNGSDFIIAKETTAARETLIDRHIGLVQNEYRDIENNLRLIFSHLPEFKDEITPPTKIAETNYRKFMNLNLRLKKEDTIPASEVRRYIDTGTGVIDSFRELHNTARLILVNLLEERRAEIQIRLAVGTLSMITALAVLLYLFLSFYRQERQLFTTLLEERDLNLNLVESLPGLFFLINAEENFICWNKEFERITGYSSAEIAGLHPGDLVGEEDREQLKHGIDQVFREGRATIEVEIVTREGKKLPYYATGNRISLKDEPFIVGFAIDISERKNLENELLYANKLLNTQLETSPDGILIVDRDMRMLNWNRRFLELWRIPREIMDNGDAEAALRAASELVENHDDFINEIKRLYNHLDESEDGAEIRLKNGVVLERYSRGARDNEGFCCWARVWHYRDITNRKEIEQQLRNLSITDPLTGSFNRTKFGEDLKWFQGQANRYHHPLTLISFDIDNFKQINDTFGHDVGDEVLKQVVNIILDTVRQTDNLYRCGGEEFNLLLPQTSLEGGEIEADRLCRTIAKTDFPKAGRITISMGVAQYRQGEELRNLLKRLDEALYRAKHKGKNRVELESPNHSTGKPG